MSFVGVQDVLYVANTIRSATYQTVTVFTGVAVLYWALCLLSSLGFRGLERLLPLNRVLKATGSLPSGPNAPLPIAIGVPS